MIFYFSLKGYFVVSITIVGLLNSIWSFVFPMFKTSVLSVQFQIVKTYAHVSISIHQGLRMSISINPDPRTVHAYISRLTHCSCLYLWAHTLSLYPGSKTVHGLVSRLIHCSCPYLQAYKPYMSISPGLHTTHVYTSKLTDCSHLHLSTQTVHVHTTRLWLFMSISPGSQTVHVYIPRLKDCPCL